MTMRLLFVATMVVAILSVMFISCPDEEPDRILTPLKDDAPAANYFYGASWKGDSIDPNNKSSTSATLTFGSDGTGTWSQSFGSGTPDEGEITDSAYDPETNIFYFVIDSTVKFLYNPSLGNEDALFTFAFKRQGTGSTLVGTWEGRYESISISIDPPQKMEDAVSILTFKDDGTYTLDTTITEYSFNYDTQQDEPVGTPEVSNTAGEWQITTSGKLQMKNPETEQLTEGFQDIPFMYSGDVFAFGIKFDKQ
jgi:hypothetical protein